MEERNIRWGELAGGLLHNIYRAFDYRGEEQIYDVLAKSVTGNLADMSRSQVVVHQPGFVNPPGVHSCRLQLFYVKSGVVTQWVDVGGKGNGGRGGIEIFRHQRIKLRIT